MSSALPRPAAVRAAALALAVAAVSGCGAGFEAQTYLERSSAEAVNEAVGTIAIRNLHVAPGQDGRYEVGDDAEAPVTFVNRGDEDDRLVDVSSPAARSVEVLQDDAPVDAVEVPRLQTTGSTVVLRLVGLTEEVVSGSSVEMTLRFERGGEITLNVPVATTGEYDEDRERSANFHPPGEQEHEVPGDTSREGEAEGDEGLSDAGEQSTEDH